MGCDVLDTTIVWPGDVIRLPGITPRKVEELVILRHF